MRRFRTDRDGTVIAVSDGKTVRLTLKKDEPTTVAPATGPVIGNVNSLIFPRLDCDNLPQEKNRVWFPSREAAIDAGYRPCRTCRP